MQEWNRRPAWIGLVGVAALIAALIAGGGAQAALAQGKTDSGPGKPAPTDIPYRATPVNGLPADLVWTIAFDPTDRPWVGTYGGGAVMQKNGEWQPLTTADGLSGDSVLAYLFTPGGQMWVGTDRGLDVFSGEYPAGEKVAEYSWNDGMAASSVQDLALDAAGNIWAAHLAEGVSRFDGEEWRVYTTSSTAGGLADNWVYAITLAPDGVLWFGTGAGVSALQRENGGETWTTYTPAATGGGLPGEWVSDVAAAPDGRLWFATDHGVSEFDGQAWTAHLAGRAVRTVAVAADGKVWAAGGGFVSYWDGAAWHDVQPTYFANQLVITLTPRANGEVWTGSLEDGATILTPKTGAPISAPASAAAATTLWAGTQNGVMALSGGDQQRFTTQDGLAGNDVRAILIDQEGRKWFATDGGASMYDGVAWTSYYPSFSGISSNYVQRAAVDPQGRVWLAYGDRGLGLSVQDGDEWRQYTAADGLADEHVYSIAFGADGETWAGTAGGVFHLNGTRWAQHGARSAAPAGKVTALAAAPNGDLWAGFADGVAVYDGKTWTSFGPDEGLTVGPVHAITFDAATGAEGGGVWVGAAPSSLGRKDGGLFYYDGVDWTVIDVNRTQTAYSGAAAQPSGDWITDLAVDEEGRLWAGALRYPLAKPVSVVGGVSAYTGDVLGDIAADVGWTNYTTDNGLVSDYVTALTFDTEGRLWVGTGDGLSMYDGKRWRSYTAADGLSNLSVTDVAADPAGGVWVTTWGGGAAHLDGANAWSYVTTVGMADREVNALAEDAAGGIWFATAGGVSHFDGDLWTTYTTLDGLADNDSRAVVVDGEGNVWVGGGGGKYEGRGLSRFDGEQWTTYTLSGDTTYANVSGLAVDPQGRPWAVGWNPQQFSAASALFRFDGEEWIQQAASLTGPAGSLRDDQVYAAVFDAAGALWLGTDGSYNSAPLLVRKGETWTIFPDISAGAVLAVAVEAPGHAFLGTDAGLARLDIESGRMTLAWEPALHAIPVQALAFEP